MKLTEVFDTVTINFSICCSTIKWISFK